MKAQKRPAETPIEQDGDTASMSEYTGLSPTTPPPTRPQKRCKGAETPAEQDDDTASISEHTDVSPEELPTMEVLEVNSLFKPMDDDCKPENDEGDDFVFSHTKMTLRLNTGELFYTIINERVYSEVAGHVFDLDQLDVASIDSQDIVQQFATVIARGLELPPDQQLDLILIPEEAIYPEFPSSLTRAPEKMLKYCHIKEPKLREYEADGGNSNLVSNLVLQEAKVCEVLHKNPHPNIAKYWGCEVVNGRIRGLCLGKYVMTLQERIETGVPLDIKHCLQGISNGILHLHSLGLIHNDINPRNIMLDTADNPIIIDFDTCVGEGEELASGGTPDWSLDNMDYSVPENDFYGLSKLEEFLTTPPEQEECPEQG